MSLHEERINDLLRLVKDAGKRESENVTPETEVKDLIGLCHLLADAAGALADLCDAEFAAKLGCEGNALFLAGLLKALRATTAAFERVNAVLSASPSATVAGALGDALRKLKEQSDSTAAEIQLTEISVEQVLTENRELQEELQRRIREVDQLYEKNKRLEKGLKIYSNVNLQIAQSLPNRFQHLGNRLNRITAELQEIDGELKQAVEEHQRSNFFEVEL
jgi:hypothetical protein